MELCVLPQTGAGEPWLLIAVIAAAIIAAGIALAASGRARRSVLTGLGALAIVGALLVVGVGGAAPAQADAGSVDCITAPAAPREVAAATIVTPGIPTTTAQCGAEPSVQIPTTQGVVYTQTREGTALTVVATAAPGFALLSSATSTFQLDLTPSVRAPWPVALPPRTSATIGDGDAGGGYLIPADPALVPALQGAADAGTGAYSLDGSNFRFELDVVAIDPETSAELGRTTIAQPLPSTLTYDFERGEYLVQFDDDGEIDIFPLLIEAAEALQAQFPDAQVRIAPEQTDARYDGLQILASYEPGVACATESVVVPIDLGFPQILPPVGIVDSIDEAAARFQADADAAEAADAPASESTEAPTTDAPVTAAPATDDSEAPAPDEAVVVDEIPAEER